MRGLVGVGMAKKKPRVCGAWEIVQTAINNLRVEKIKSFIDSLIWIIGKEKAKIGFRI